VSLDNVAKVALRRGDLGVAEQTYARSLTIREDLNRQLGTPESARDLSVSLDNVAQVALRRGDLGVAEQTLSQAVWAMEEACNKMPNAPWVAELERLRNMLRTTRGNR
jgi:Tfp pilus assembly protein PilF